MRKTVELLEKCTPIDVTLSHQSANSLFTQGVCVERGRVGWCECMCMCLCVCLSRLSERERERERGRIYVIYMF